MQRRSQRTWTEILAAQAERPQQRATWRTEVVNGHVWRVCYVEGNRYRRLLVGPATPAKEAWND